MENRAESRALTAESNLPEHTPGEPAVGSGSALESSSFLKVLDRKDELVPIPDGSLFVWDGVLDLEIGVILKLSVDELVFEYFDQGWVMAETGSFDLLTNAGMCISALPYRLDSDKPIEEETSPTPIRRASVRFGPLHPAKRTALETLISIYGKRAAAARTERYRSSSPQKAPKSPSLETADQLP